MTAPVVVEVDFNLVPDGVHTLTTLSSVSDPTRVRVGERVVATDGDDAYWAVVTDVDRDRATIALSVYWDQPADRREHDRPRYRQAG